MSEGREQAMPEHAELAARFRAQAERAGAVVHELADWPEVAALALRLAAPDGRVAVPPALARQRPQLVEALGERALVPGPEDPAAAVADATVGVEQGRLAVAETGSVLVADHDLVDRVVSMLAVQLIQVVERGRLAASLDDAADWLQAHRGAGYAALVTGPSRSADIERSLTIGVQGPGAVHVALLGPA